MVMAFLSAGGHSLFYAENNGIECKSDGKDDAHAPGQKEDQQVVEYHATGNKHDKDQIGPPPVPAQKGIDKKEKVSRERVPHPPEPAETLFRKAFPDHPEHHLTGGHAVVPPAAEVLVKSNG
jgi:hypothetical protein